MKFITSNQHQRPHDTREEYNPDPEFKTPKECLFPSYTETIQEKKRKK